MRLDPPIFIEYAIIPFIIAFLGINAYTDYKKCKIYNKYLLFGLAAAVVWHLFYGLYVNLDGGMSHLRGELKEAISPDISSYYLNTLRNFALALLLGFILWRFNLWAAGDAKLFSVLSLLVPFYHYKSSFYEVFPSHVLLFNMMFAVIAILLIEMLFKLLTHLLYRGLNPSNIGGGILRWFKGSYKQLPKLLVMFSLIFTILTFLRNFLGAHFQLDKIMIFLLLLILIQPLMRILMRKYIFYRAAILSGVGIAALIILPIEGVTLGSILQFTVIVFSVMVFRALYDSYLLYFDYRAVKVDELSPGMLLADKTKKIIPERGEGKYSLESLGELLPEGLTEEQVAMVKEWANNTNTEEIYISKPLPFAPAMFVGLIMTIFSSGYAISF